jgi:uncharacterized protein (UPF0261 family)
MNWSLEIGPWSLADVMSRTIALLAALDAAGPGAAFVRDHIRKHGVRVLVIDAGATDGPAFKPDIDRKAFYAAAGLEIEAIRAMEDRAEAVAAAVKAAETLLPRLLARKQIHGAIALGGDADVAVGAAGLRALPLGIPKVLVATQPSAATAPIDACLVGCPTGFGGVNRISRTLLAHAANAIAGMVRGPVAPRAGRDRPLVALTVIDDTAPCAEAARRLLEARGFECLRFRADGNGGRTMDRLASEGHLAGLCDLTAVEWTSALAGGPDPARPGVPPDRRLPRIVSTGGLDRLRFGPPETVPEPFRTRPLRPGGPSGTLVRTTREESLRLGEILAQHVNATAGPTRVILPLRGLSALDGEGRPFDDPDARRALYDAIQANLDLGSVELVELDHHLNDTAFGEALAKALLGLMGPAARPAKAAKPKRVPPKARPKAAKRPAKKSRA